MLPIPWDIINAGGIIIDNGLMVVPKDNFMADSFANNDNDVVEAPIDAFTTNSNMMTTLADIKMTIEEDDEDADDVFEEAPKPKSKKSKKVNAKKRKSPVKKKASKKKAPAKKKATKRIVVDDDDEDFELPSVKVSATAKSKFTMNISDSDDSDEEFGSLMSRIKSRRTAGKPKPKYNFDSDSDDDFDMQTMTSEISSISRKISDDSGSMPSKTTKKKSKVISKKKIIIAGCSDIVIAGERHEIAAANVKNSNKVSFLRMEQLQAAAEAAWTEVDAVAMAGSLLSSLFLRRCPDENSTYPLGR